MTKISLSFSAGYNGCGAGLVAWTLIFLLATSALPAGIRPTAGMIDSPERHSAFRNGPLCAFAWTRFLTSEYSMEGDPFPVRR